MATLGRTGHLNLAVIAFLAVGACSPAVANNEALFSEAKKAIAKEVASPASAVFRSVRIASDPASADLGVVCGEVQGGEDQFLEASYRRFIYSRAANLSAVEVLLSDDADVLKLPEAEAFGAKFEELWKEMCL